MRRRSGEADGCEWLLLPPLPSALACAAAAAAVVVFAAGCSEIERGFMMAAVGGDRGALDSAGR